MTIFIVMFFFIDPSRQVLSALVLSIELEKD